MAGAIFGLRLCFFPIAAFWLGMLLNERETLERVLQSVGPPSVENISIWHAGSRVLAQDIIATVALPRFDNSTMDGYAVRAEDAMTGARLLVTGEQAAGPDLALKVGPGEAIRIYTGAPVPGPADAVIMQEDVDADERTILIREGVISGENIRARGGDLCEGQKVAVQRRPPDRAELGRHRFAGHKRIPGLISVLAWPSWRLEVS